jgi:archaellum component FlaC
LGRLQNDLVGSSRQVLDLREEIGRLQADLVVAQYGGPSSELSGSREEIERLKAEVQSLTDAHAVSSREVSCS